MIIARQRYWGDLVSQSKTANCPSINNAKEKIYDFIDIMLFRVI